MLAAVEGRSTLCRLFIRLWFLSSIRLVCCPICSPPPSAPPPPPLPSPVIIHLPRAHFSTLSSSPPALGMLTAGERPR